MPSEVTKIRGSTLTSAIDPMSDGVDRQRFHCIGTSVNLLKPGERCLVSFNAKCISDLGFGVKAISFLQWYLDELSAASATLCEEILCVPRHGTSSANAISTGCCRHENIMILLRYAVVILETDQAVLQPSKPVNSRIFLVQL